MTTIKIIHRVSVCDNNSLFVIISVSEMCNSRQGISLVSSQYRGWVVVMAVVIEVWCLLTRCQRRGGCCRDWRMWEEAGMGSDMAHYGTVLSVQLLPGPLISSGSDESWVHRTSLMAIKWAWCTGDHGSGALLPLRRDHHVCVWQQRQRLQLLPHKLQKQTPGACRSQLPDSGLQIYQ